MGALFKMFGYATANSTYKIIIAIRVRGANRSTRSTRRVYKRSVRHHFNLV